MSRRLGHFFNETPRIISILLILGFGWCFAWLCWYHPLFMILLFIIFSL
jgi:hypothetical protein